MILIIGYIVYFVLACVHLVACFLEKETFRKVTKPLLMIVLVVIAFIYMITSKEFNILLLLAVLFGLVGDILLIYKNKKITFTIGGISFFIGHFLYIINILHMVNFKYKWLLILIVILTLFGWFLFSYNKFKPYLKKLALCCTMYSFILLLGLFLSIITIIIGPTISGIFLSIGFLLFIVSDSILVYDGFVSKIKRSHFYLMIPYILAQGLIVLGILIK